MSSISQNGGTILLKQVDSSVQYQLSGSNLWQNIATFPVTFNNTETNKSLNPLTVKFTTNLTLTSATAYFICGTEYIIFDGDDKICLIQNVTGSDVSPTDGYPGLIQNGLYDLQTNTTSAGKSNITVQHIKVHANNARPVFNSGWVCQRSFGNYAVNNLVTHCSSNGTLIYAGAILGHNSGNQGELTVTHCFSTGNLTGSGCGGIVGSQATYVKLLVSDCYSTGDISYRSGGIIGQLNSGNIEIIRCYSTGEIGNGGGGICGALCGRVSGTITVSNCYSTGDMLNGDAGGILGPNCGSIRLSTVVRDCWSTGDMYISGGITSGGTNLTIQRCRSYGRIGSLSGGISYAPYSPININDCHSTGFIYQGSGILQVSNPVDFVISDCYSLGEMDHNGCGIFNDHGLSTETSMVVSNVYSAGKMLGQDSDICYGITNNVKPITQTNVYVADGNWSDTVAKQNLIGYPTNENNNIGSVWYSTGLNIPFGLTETYLYVTGVTNELNVLEIVGNAFSKVDTVFINNTTNSVDFEIVDGHHISVTLDESVGYVNFIRVENAFGEELFDFNVNPPLMIIEKPTISSLTLTPTRFNDTVTTGVIELILESSNLFTVEQIQNTLSLSYYQNIGQISNVVKSNSDGTVWTADVVITSINYRNNCVVKATSSELYANSPFSSSLFIVADICFVKGTRIETDQGFIPIEEICVKTHTIKNKKIIEVTQTISKDTYLVCFQKDSLGMNIPSEKTIMSKNHQLYYEGEMVSADFILHQQVDGVHKVKYRQEILYNIVLEKYDTLVANNMICETLHPKNINYLLLNKLKQYDIVERNAMIERFNELKMQMIQ